MTHTWAGAELSADRLYRYRLWRRVGPSHDRVVFVMLNPSTADGTTDDPTIRRCIRFAQREGCGWLDVVNLYALRATDPVELKRAADPVGPGNDEAITAATLGARLVIAAWGGWPGPVPGRVEQVRELAGPVLYCLGTTKDGSPRHPLYVRGDAPLVGWRP